MWRPILAAQSAVGPEEGRGTGCGEESVEGQWPSTATYPTLRSQSTVVRLSGAGSEALADVQAKLG